MMLEVEQRSGDTDSDQEELESGVDLGDGGGLDGGGGQGGVEVFLDGEGRDDAHVPDVQPRVDQEQVPGHESSSIRAEETLNTM